MIKIVFLILFFGLCDQSVFAQEESYGAYNLYAQGSLRAVGMGGASTALSDSAAGVTSNPAGIVMGDYGVSLDSSNNPVDSTELGTTIENDSQFIMAAVAAHLGEKWSVGAAYNSPYLFQAPDTASADSKLQLTTISAALARRFGDFSLGVAGHYVTADLFYDDFSSSASDKASSIFPSAGISYWQGKFGVGISYRAKYSIDIDESKNNGISSFQPFFRDIDVPAKLSIGVFYRPNKKIMWIGEINRFYAPEDSVAPETDPSSSTTFQLDESPHNSLHLGFEYLLTSSKNMEITFRGGAYLEPSKIDPLSGFALEDFPTWRTHLTYGIEARMGPVVIGVSFDQAKDFQNSSQALSISFGSI